MRSPLSLLLAYFALTFLLGASAAAQVDPSGVYRSFETPHFRIHFRVSEDSAARFAAVIAEDAYRALSTELDPPNGVIDLLLTDNVDITNGYAQLFPSKRIVIYMQPPVYSRELRLYGDWLKLVITHELVHIFQIDKAGGWWKSARYVFGRNPMLFPNALAPRWLKEGLAVHYESKFTGTGRIVSTSFPTLAHVAAISGEIPSLGKWSAATSEFPLGQTAYAWGSMLMHRAANADTNGTVRSFVNTLGAQTVPFMLGSASKKAFGSSFNDMYEELRDSLYSSVHNVATARDTMWQEVSQYALAAVAPRWHGQDTIVWAASDGREVTGAYQAVLTGTSATVTRLARRNSLDANSHFNGSFVFAQHELSNPYVYRSDLYSAQRSGGREHRLTNGERLSQPDVRHDGIIVATKVENGKSFLVKVSANGSEITRLTPETNNSWSDPRWSANGDMIAAIELLTNGTQRVVVLKDNGELRSIVAGGFGVFSSPSFTPDGKRLVWASDRSGRSQIETGRLGSADDTTLWISTSHITSASNVSSALFDPSVSPDGKRIAALSYSAQGWRVVVGALDTTGAQVSGSWYPLGAQQSQSSVWSSSAESGKIRDTLQSQRYNSLRQLLPTYWTPVSGGGRVSSTYGLSSSGYDITERHSWSAAALVAPRNSEVDGYASYRFAGFGVPLIDAGMSQDWDATIRVIDSSGALIGDVARRRRFASLSATVPIPRVRHALSATAGVQFEMRKFASDSDAALGAAGSVTRRGTTYQSFFGSVSASTTRSGARAISAEEGFSVSASTSYRWRTDIPQLTESWRTVAVARGFVPLPLPGFSRHVIAARVAAGSADRNTASEFSIGGVSGISSQIAPGIVVGDPARTFPLRGVIPGAQRGSKALGASIEYRAPMSLLSRGFLPFPVFADKVSLNTFVDAGRAWCPAGVRLLFETQLCDRRSVADGWVASTGAELSFDIALQYDVPYRIRAGFGVPIQRPAAVGKAAMGYVTLGSFF